MPITVRYGDAMILFALDMMVDRLAVSQTGLRQEPPAPARARPAWIAWAASLPLLTITLAAAAILIAATGIAPLLQWDRAAAGPRVVWQLLTCHLTHWSADHLLWDLLGLLILGALCERQSRRATAQCLLLSSLAIALGVQIFRPELAFYRGLSGVDSALFGLLAMLWLRDARAQNNWQAAAWPALMLTLFAAKLAIELTSGAAVFVQTPELLPVPLAHLIGLACGLAIGATRPSPLRGRTPSRGIQVNAGRRCGQGTTEIGAGARCPVSPYYSSAYYSRLFDSRRKES